MNRTMNVSANARKFLAVGVLSLLLSSANVTLAQHYSGDAAHKREPLPYSVELLLNETNRNSFAQLEAVDRAWRNVFREARSREKLKGFVKETLDLFEKLRQFKDFVVSSSDTKTRVGGMFRKMIMDEDTICASMEKVLVEYCQSLDSQDQALLIKLKIDRDVDRTNLPRSVLDIASFKRPIKEASAAAVKAVENDMSRSIATVVASELVSRGATHVARESGFMPGDPGSVGDFFASMLIDYAVGKVIDQVTDPTPAMITGLEKQLIAAERAILDGSANGPGFISALRKVTEERAQARRKLLEAELSK